MLGLGKLLKHFSCAINWLLCTHAITRVSRGNVIHQVGSQICACKFAIGQMSLKILLVFSLVFLKNTTVVKIGQTQVIRVLFVHSNKKDAILFDLQFRKLK